MELTIAADVGKRMDQTAIAIVQRVRPEPPHTDTSKWPTTWKVPGRESLFHVRELGRMRLGTRYTDQAYELAKTAHDVRCFDPEGSLAFLLDATGVGEGIADLLNRYLPSSVRLQKCWFTASERVERVRGELRVGKPFMISRLTSLIETGRVKFGDIPQRLDLVEELQSFEYRITASGNYTADAKSGAHDDLITCLGLATLIESSAAPRYTRTFGADTLQGPGDDWELLHRVPPTLW